ncbi:MAG: hypothetical protein GY854_23155, partial [Deltaproteobacteria bacterium]|nr:hypothetical protein [Deltaproteobacteria bacterium]
MPAVLTHLSVLFLARRRLAQIRDLLDAKTNAGRITTDLEHRMLFLAGNAHRMLTEHIAQETEQDEGGNQEPLTGYADGVSYGDPLGRGTSRFAALGCMGPDIPAFSALLAPGQGWLADLVHKGNPDCNREPVVAGSCDLALEIWAQAKTAIGSLTGDNEADQPKNQARNQVRSYVLGHLCHVAADLISHPFTNDLEWHRGKGSREKLSPLDCIGNIDAKAATQVLRRESTRDGPEWKQYWPDKTEVPEELFTAYAAALREIYYNPTLPVGFGHFQEMFGKHAPPELDAALIKDGYEFFYDGVLDKVYDWKYGTWLAVMIPAVASLGALFPLALSLKYGSELRTKNLDEIEEGERAFFDIFMLPFATTSIIPVFYGTWLTSLSSKGVESLAGAGLTFSYFSLLFSIAFFATSNVPEVAWWVRWILFFGVPFVSGLAFVSTWFANMAGEDNWRRKWMAFVFAFPFIVFAIFSTAYAALLMTTSGSGSNIIYWILLIIVAVGVLVTWFVLPAFARDLFIPEEPKTFAAEMPHYVRLFDETTLHHAPDEANPERLKSRYFPSGPRKLLKLWWTGAGDKYIRMRRTFIEFSSKENPAENEIERVPAPIAPMTSSEYLDFLKRVVPGLDGAVVYSDENQYLPPGATFSDEGDAAEAENPDDLELLKSLQHDEVARKFKKLATSDEGSKYYLRHAPKTAQAIRYGKAGAIPFVPHDNLGADGVGAISSIHREVTGDGTLFRTFFAEGDRIRANNQIRIVTQIRSDTVLVVSAAFDPDLAAKSYERLVEPHDELTVQGDGVIQSNKEDVTGYGTIFRSFFVEGDRIRSNGQIRTIKEVISDTALKIFADFEPELEDGTFSNGQDYERMSTGDETRSGYSYLTDPTLQHLGGEAVMDYAVDLSAMLCMGAVPHLMDGEVTVSSLSSRTSGGDPVDATLTNVHQVFRNWNMDRRRINEWRMLVAGDAVSDKRAEYRPPSPAPTPPPPP